jgi:hypothetical protein
MENAYEYIEKVGVIELEDDYPYILLRMVLALSFLVKFLLRLLDMKLRRK